MKIAIVGCGALGLYYGGRLAQAAEPQGWKVWFLARGGAADLRADGLTVKSIGGDFHLPRINVADDPAAVGAADLILIGIKSFANGELERLVAPLYAPGRSAVLTLQNGIGNEEALLCFLPREAVFGGVAFLCANRLTGACVEHTAFGAIRLAPAPDFLPPGRARPPSAAATKRAEAIAAALRAAGLEAGAVRAWWHMRYRKLVWNVPFNALCALSDRPTAGILADPTLRSRAANLMREVIELGDEAAAAFGEDFDPESVDDFIRGQFAATAAMGDYLPSMLLDRRAGRPLETDSILRRPLAAKARYGWRAATPEWERLAAEII